MSLQQPSRPGGYLGITCSFFFEHFALRTIAGKSQAAFSYGRHDTYEGYLDLVFANLFDGWALHLDHEVTG